MRTTISTKVVLGLTALAGAVAAQEAGSFVQTKVLGALEWREAGPTAFGGRIVDLAVDPTRPATYYVATATGGLFRTTNAGTSFTAHFTDEKSFSIGAVAIAPSDSDVLYVGTGEGNNQRSSYWGNGVYRTADAGKTWTHVGLDGTDHIGRIAVHPTDPNTVFVAALGTLYTPNETRGVYRSKDGGETWSCVHFVSEDVGCVDIVIDPARPEIVYAATYERRRRAHHFDASGPGSAIYKSSDGGDTWTRLGGGLPEGEIGRIGLAIFPGDTDVVFASIENRNPAPPKTETKAERDNERSRGRSAAPGYEPRERLVGGQVFRSDDAGESWTLISGDKSVGGSPAYYYGQIRVDPVDPQKLYLLSVPVHSTTDGGETWKTNFANGLHVDHHAMWIDPGNPSHIILGNDGGLATTWDRGNSWYYYNDLPIGQFYAVGTDLRDPYWIYGGTQDNGTWGIPSTGPTMRGIEKHDAVKVSGGDGFYVCVDPTDSNLIYAESQFGAIRRINTADGSSVGIRPTAERGAPDLRFNWMSPIVLSEHDPRTIYFGSQHVHRSTDRGDSWETISPDLSTNDPDKIAGNVPHCTVTTISESPLDQNLLMAGTDDGRVWLTRTGGERWIELTDRVPGLPKKLWVSRVTTSRWDADVAYVSFTGYREDIREPFLYLTTDGGETFRSISNDLPKSPINVVAEHPRNPDVLLVGHEFGIHASIDGGASWNRLGQGLPTTPVHDLQVHRRESDLIVGTHGRGIWTLDITPLEELNDRMLARGFHAFAARDGRMLPRGFTQGYTGAKGWTARNPELGAVFHYYLGQDMDEAVEIVVETATGQEVFRKSGENTAGLHAVTWTSRGGGGGFAGPRSPGPRSAGPGHYRVRLTLGKQEFVKAFQMHASPGMDKLFFSDEWEEQSVHKDRRVFR